MSLVPSRARKAPTRLHGVTIQQRVRSLALVGIVATITVAAVAFVNLQHSRTLTREVAVTSDADRFFLANQEVREEIVGRVLESLYLTAQDPTADADVARVELAAWVKEIGANNEGLAHSNLPENLTAATSQVAADLDVFVATANTMLDHIYGSQRGLAQTNLPAFLDAGDMIDHAAIAVPFRAEIEQVNARAGRSQSRAVVMLWLATALAVAVLASGAQWVVWRIRTALRQMSDAAGRMTGGDLSTRVVHEASDEVGQLADSFNVLASTLGQTFDRLESDARRESFSTKLVEALEMVDTEGEVHETVGLAMEQAGTFPMELLLSDSSRAHLERSACHPAAGRPAAPWARRSSARRCDGATRSCSSRAPTSTPVRSCATARKATSPRSACP